MKKKSWQKMVVVAIAILVIVVMCGYLIFVFWGFGQADEVPQGIRFIMSGIVSLILIPLMILMAVVAYKRNKEIEEEDEDDLGQY